jgi:hypothetical protein
MTYPLIPTPIAIFIVSFRRVLKSENEDFWKGPFTRPIYIIFFYDVVAFDKTDVSIAGNSPKTPNHGCPNPNLISPTELQLKTGSERMFDNFYLVLLYG